MFESVLEAGREALKAILIINGGAVIALLGFMGALISKGLPTSLGASLAGSIFQFGAGVLLTALGFGARYMSQAFFHGEKSRVGQTFTVISIAMALAAYAMFGLGIYGAYEALASHFSP